MRPPETFIQQPVRSLQTMLQVIALGDPRIPTVIPDGIYGQTTISAVNRFQQLYGMPITGIADQATWEKIVEIYEPARINAEPAEPIEILIDRNEALKPGDSGPYVYFLQVMLRQLSSEYPSIPTPDISGHYDRTTTEAVRYFQQATELPITGETDKRTWKNLEQHFTLLVHRFNAKQINRC